MIKLALALTLALPSLKQITDEVIAFEARDQFKSYMDQYYEELRPSPAAAVPCGDVKARAPDFPFVFIGDEHTSDYPLRKMREFARYMISHGVRPVLAIEFIFHQYQPDLDLYLTSKIDAAELRRRVHFDDFQWAWKWENLEPLLGAARDLHLRVLAAEEGSNNMDTRDAFAARQILDDLAKHPGSRYLIMYGTAHLLGQNRIPFYIRAAGHPRMLRVIDFLGHETLDVIQAIGTEDNVCVKFEDDVYYMSAHSPKEQLIEYWEYLKSMRR
jgi:uncharacterized iron-regulated protein